MTDINWSSKKELEARNKWLEAEIERLRAIMRYVIDQADNENADFDELIVFTKLALLSEKGLSDAK